MEEWYVGKVRELARFSTSAGRLVPPVVVGRVGREKAAGRRRSALSARRIKRMTAGSVAGVIRCGDPDAITGRFVCGQARRVPTASVPARPPARSGTRRAQARRRPSRRARAPARLADDDGSQPADAVLKLVRPGRTAIITLTEGQRVALHDPDGLRALSLLAHLLAVRDPLDPDGEFPLTEKFVLRLSKRAGSEVGRNAARRVITRLRDAGVLVPAGSYRAAYTVVQPSGFRVPLWRLGPDVRVTTGRRSSANPPRRFRSATDQASVAGPRSRKPQPWWRHGLFGNPVGVPPVGVRDDVLRRWRSAKHFSAETCRENEFYAGSAA
jgi:hypothetical protein